MIPCSSPWCFGDAVAARIDGDRQIHLCSECLANECAEASSLADWISEAREKMAN